MALWPFRRKSGRKRSRSGAAMSDSERAPPRTQTDDPNLPRRPSQKKQRTESHKLQRRVRTYSFEAGRRDSLGARGGRRDRHDGGLPAGRSIEDRIDEEDSIPTLHVRKDNRSMPRRKSSKRRREDLDREAEIKAMSNFVPHRPAADTWTAGRPTREESKRRKIGMGIEKLWDNPSSDISLPFPASIESSRSSGSEYASYKIGALEALAPRPTLRYAVYPRWTPASDGSAPAGMTPQKRKDSSRPPIAEDTLRDHKRIDDLADDLSASDLRELMERDKRRRERKRQKEQEKMERRLARRAEKQTDGSPSQPNLDRGVMGRELVGLGIDTTSAVVTSSRRRPSDVSPSDKTADATTAPGPRPLDKFHRTDSIPLQTPVVESRPELEETDHTPPPMPKIHTKRKLLRSKKSRSQSPPLADRDKATPTPQSTQPEEPETPQKSRLSLSSLFRWGGKNRRSSAQSSFANTSREEMQAAIAAQAPQPPAAPALAAQAGSAAPAVPAVGANTTTPKRSLSSGVPKRTKSKFREDLPELPLSPPASRLHSPEVEPVLAIVTENQDPAAENERRGIPMRFDTPTSGHRSLDEAMRQTPTSLQRQGHSPEPPSISLASIDSEASWLSGRLGGRRSANMRGEAMSSPYQQYHNHHHQHYRTNSNGDSTGNNTEDELAEDEYLSRLTPPARRHYRTASQGGGQRISTGEALPSSDEDEPMTEDGDMKWGSVGAERQPALRHANEREAGMIKSREGLLNSLGEEDYDVDDESDESDGSLEHDKADEAGIEKMEEEGGLQRATSVNLGKGHARHISAGSAKLLELSPRLSGDRERKSADARRGSGLAFM